MLHILKDGVFMHVIANTRGGEQGPDTVRADPDYRHEGFDLGGPVAISVATRPMQWFDAEPIPAEMNGLVFENRESKGEHATDYSHGWLDSPVGQTGKEH